MWLKWKHTRRRTFGSSNYTEYIRSQSGGSILDSNQYDISLQMLLKKTISLKRMHVRVEKWNMLNIWLCHVLKEHLRLVGCLGVMLVRWDGAIWFVRTVAKAVMSSYVNCCLLPCVKWDGGIKWSESLANGLTQLNELNLSALAQRCGIDSKSAERYWCVWHY